MLALRRCVVFQFFIVAKTLYSIVWIKSSVVWTKLRKQFEVVTHKLLMSYWKCLSTIFHLQEHFVHCHAFLMDTGKHSFKQTQQLQTVFADEVMKQARSEVTGRWRFLRKNDLRDRKRRGKIKSKSSHFRETKKTWATVIGHVLVHTSSVFAYTNI